MVTEFFDLSLNQSVAFLEQFWVVSELQSLGSCAVCLMRLRCSVGDKYSSVNTILL